jgi:hypothetical protein
MSNEPRIDYVEHDSGDGRVQPIVVGGNGEIQARLEWYDSQSNAERGVLDLYASLAAILVKIELPA